MDYMPTHTKNLTGSIGGIESGLRVIILMWFSFFLFVLSWFLGGFVRRGSTISSKSCIWIFRFHIFLGRGIKLQIRFLSMLWSFRLILGGSLPRRYVLLYWQWLHGPRVFSFFLMFSFSFWCGLRASFCLGLFSLALCALLFFVTFYFLFSFYIWILSRGFSAYDRLWCFFPLDQSNFI